MRKVHPSKPGPDRSSRSRNSPPLFKASHLVILLLAVMQPSPRAQLPGIIPEIEIDQAALMQGNYSFQKVVESGRHLFSTPFNTFDGHGEGPEGPRRSTQQLYAGKSFRFLRLNGLDSQSCFECHNSIGSDVQSDTASTALSRKNNVIGGSAGFASSAFINPSFPDPLVTFIRNPPHLFGIGYGQQLAKEMTFDLLGLRLGAQLLAMVSPGVRIEQELISKGTRFGTYAVTFEGTMKKQPLEIRDNILLGTGLTEDYSSVEGVSEDLVVRPFQWKGNASNERNFVKDALNFHFGIQGEELFFDEDEQNPGQVYVTELDNDEDGVENEISPGNISALTVFTTVIRPPVQVIPAGKEAMVERGRTIFTGEATDVIMPGRQNCADCHTPSLSINDSEVVVRDPTDLSNLERPTGGQVGLPVSHAAASDLPVIRSFKKALSAVTPAGFADPESLAKELKNKIVPLVGYHYDLTEMDSLPMSYPRLPENMDGSIDVPLFSDIRRHRMGEALQDVADQGTDAGGIMVPADQFLTRPLWGVADTGPWLHDGRALTLEEAILLHESTGSEANPAIEDFRALSESDRAAVITFLLTLRLPDENLAPPENRIGDRYWSSIK
jgi:hypothetical protein